MIYVSEIKTTIPTVFNSQLQEKVYKTLESLGIPFQRVDNDAAITMEDCIEIDKRLDMKTVKTLFLCNRQQTEFYLFVTAGDKPFVTKDFSHAMNISRVSFAPAEMLLSMLGTPVGATTVLSLVADTDKKIKVVIDREVAAQPWYGCSDGTTTGYIKLSTADVLNLFLTHTGHTPTVIEV